MKAVLVFVLLLFAPAARATGSSSELETGGGGKCTRRRSAAIVQDLQQLCDNSSIEEVNTDQMIHINPPSPCSRRRLVWLRRLPTHMALTC
eukprot:SAG31_NODE_13829_length_843_cov_1.905914_1_plen_91_part_00